MKNTKRKTTLSPLFADVLYEWLETNRIRLKLQTYTKYQQVMMQHIVPALGDVPAQQLSSAMLNQFLYEKAMNGRMDGTGGLSSSSVRMMAFIIKSAFTYAQQKYDVPALKGDITLPSRDKRQLEVLSIAEQTLLEQTCMHKATDKDVAILLSLYTGIRLGEVCGLQGCDINYHTNTMHISHTVERVSNPQKTASHKTMLMLLDTKTASSNRVIPLPSNIKTMLFPAQSGFLVKGYNGSYADPRTMQYFFQKRLKECGIRSVNYHALRHTFATRCMESGMDIKSLSEILGHSNVNITMNIYVHSSMEHKRKQLECMVSQCTQHFVE